MVVTDFRNAIGIEVGGMRDLFGRLMVVGVVCGVLGSVAVCSAQSTFLVSYKGTPYHDSKYSGGAQAVPGKVMCAYYDLGGEGVAYHDSDAKNNGSGALNPANGTYLNEFRMN